MHVSVWPTGVCLSTGTLSSRCLRGDAGCGERGLSVRRPLAPVAPQYVFVMARARLPGSARLVVGLSFRCTGLSFPQYVFVMARAGLPGSARLVVGLSFCYMGRCRCGPASAYHHRP
jgi:hypothetical protein